MAEESTPSPRRKALLWTYGGVLLLIAIGIFVYWLFWLRFEEYTNDAYVTGNMVTLTPQISGIVVSINADETDMVEKDQLVIELDPTDATLAYEEKKAEFAEALRQTIALFEKVGELKAEVEEKKATLWMRALDYEHRKELVNTGGVSREDFEHAEAHLRIAFASLVDTEHMLISAAAQIENTSVLTHPQVEKAQEKFKEAYVHLQRCKIVAPVTGLVAQRKAQVGERVPPGGNLLAIIPLDEIWVYANFKENQLRKMRVGQPVQMWADIYGRKVPYHGKIIGLSGGTGSVFSIIPPQNATGNWIKIVQRLPVKISLDPEEIRNNPLFLGLSMQVTVDLHEIEGSSIQRPKPLVPIYQTDIFGKQLDGADQAVQEIVEANVSKIFLQPNYYEELGRM